jgi:hypothetical protein
MAYQINTGPMNPITTYVPAGGAWSFQLQQTDCPVIGVQYLLTVYAGDTTGNFSNDSDTITRTS